VQLKLKALRARPSEDYIRDFLTTGRRFMLRSKLTRSLLHHVNISASVTEERRVLLMRAVRFSSRSHSSEAQLARKCSKKLTESCCSDEYTELALIASREGRINQTQ